MTSNLYSNNHSIRRLYFWTLRKNAVVIAVCTVLTLIARPGILIHDYFELLNSYPNQSMSYPQTSYLYYSVDTSNNLATFIIAILAVTLMLINLSYLHSKKASDMFGALPIKRASLLLCRAGAAVTGAVISIVVSGIGEAIAVSFMNIKGTVGSGIIQAVQYTVGESLITSGMLMAMTVAVSAMTMLIAVICGTALDCLLSLLVVNAGCIIINNIFIELANQTLIGYEASSNIGYMLSPFAAMFGYTAGYPYSGWLKSLLYWLIFGALLILLSVVFIKKRKNDLVGKNYTYKILPIIFSVISSVIVGYFLGRLFSEKIVAPVFFVFFLIGSLLAAVIYHCIATRGFKQLWKAIITGVVCTAVFIAVSLCFHFDIIGYNTSLPDIKLVRRASLSGRYDDSPGAPNSFNTNNSRLQECVIELHRQIIENPDKLNYSGNSEDLNGIYNSYYFTFEYSLYGGVTMKRTYSVNGINLDSYLKPILNSDEYLNENDPLLKALRDGRDMSVYDAVEIGEYYGTISPVYSPDAYLIEDIIGAYEADYLLMANEDLKEGNQYHIRLYTKYGLKPGDVYQGDIDIYINKKYKRTMYALEGYGILDELEEHKREYYGSYYSEYCDNISSDTDNTVHNDAFSKAYSDTTTSYSYSYDVNSPMYYMYGDYDESSSNPYPY